MANKGSILKMDDVLGIGDYLQSDMMPTGFYRATMEASGDFVVRWFISNADPIGYPIWHWNTPGASYAKMHGGNFCVYNSSNVAMVCSNITSGSYVVMQGDGHLCVRDANNAFVWGTHAYTVDHGAQVVLSNANGNWDLVLSSVPPLDGLAKGASVENWFGTPEQRWQVVYLYRNDTFLAFVLLNAAKQKVVGASEFTAGRDLRMWDTIGDAALLLVTPYDGRIPMDPSVGIRFVNDEFYFNVRGTPPYGSGLEAIVFQKQVEKDGNLVANETWKFQAVAAAVGV